MTENKYCMVTLDTETTMNNKIGSNAANPFCPDNRIVALGYKFNPINVSYVFYHEENKSYVVDIGSTILSSKIRVLVGQNLKFDIHHLRKAGVKIQGIPLDEWLRHNQIWDIQIAEYILTGQESQFASLDDMCVKYGLPLKDDKVKSMFDQGIGADKIDKDLLMEYLKQDVENTEAIALAQMEEASQRNMMPLIMSMMEAAIAIEDIEYNGIKIDPTKLAVGYNALLKDIECREIALKATITNDLERMQGIATSLLLPNLNLDSRHHLSALFYGGEIKYNKRESVGVDRKGNPKFKKVEKTIRIKPTIPAGGTPTSTTGVYKVDEDTLQDIKTTYAIYSAADWARDLINLKKLKKECGTYYEGLSKLIHPDGLLHPNIHQTSTDTGRTSASEPNGQNIPSSDESKVKELFVSRFGDDGVILSADYNQLEVIALAFLSRDPQLLDDIRNGRDIHTEVGKEYYGPTHKMTKEERRRIKTINFGLIYGGTANALSVQAGVTKAEAQRGIDAFYTRYPGVKDWQNRNIERVKDDAVPSAHTTKNGLPSAHSTLYSCTGRRYTFQEYDNPWKRGQTNFSPTEIKNYPVQGFATGDIVPTMLGVLWKALKNDPELKDKCYLVNIVHDEYVLDVHKDVVVKVARIVKDILVDTPKYLKSVYNIDFDLPTRVNVTWGPNWKDQSHQLLDA